MQQAFEIHEEAVAVHKQTEAKLTKLTSNEDSLFVSTYKVELNSISNSLKSWEEQLVEVPGFEHEHSGHDHDHDHDHEHHHHHDQPNLTPAQHLEVQQHLLKEIQAIEKRIDEIKSSNN